MAEHILVAIAWPYASANIHAGNVTGSHLPGDIYARYHRLAGDHVLMVSGSDSHGTPVTVVADQEGQSPRQVFERFHHDFLELFQRLGISYDLFTHTDTENHHRVSQDFFLALLERGYLYRQVQEQMYSEKQKRFLPDRYVEGTCPVCGYEGARGDQCDHCNTLLDPKDLINPRSKMDGSTPVLRKTEHFFLDLPKVARLYEDDPAKKLNLPYDVPANEFMNLEGHKISGSRNWAVWMDEALDRYDPDALRYYLTVAMPETRDTDWLWGGFVRRNNDELVATWGNLVNRALTFAYKRFNKQVPTPGSLDDVDTQLLAKIEAGFEPIGQLIANCKFRAALSKVMALAREANRYLEEKGPWFQIKEDREAAGTTIYVALKAIDSLKILFAPFLPFTSERLHQYLGYEGALFGRSYTTTFEEAGGRIHEALCYDGSSATGQWQPSQLPPGQPLRKPAPLFKKLDESVIEEEQARIGYGKPSKLLRTSEV
ncbi:MAG: hypothetical protein B6I35_15980 [Anaerolineaceae bacterium 4572_32.2]|nr:MAG: hypothetical protein B6I35_15980 [Anaerolineaceae bacterium 4572_32.2]